MPKNYRLCSWDKSEREKHPAELAEILADSKYYCLKCLRSAHDKESLCKPQKISKLNK